MGLVSAFKDKALSSAIRALANRSPLQELGTMTSFRIDTEDKEIVVTVELLGEEKPIEGRLKYRVEKGPERRLVIEEAVFSREWITKAFDSWVKGKMSFPVPESVAPLLDLLRV